MDPDGNVMWKTGREILFDKGSMIYVDGVILATDGKTTLYVIEPSPEAFKPLAKAVLLSEAEGSNRGMFSSGNWAPIALSKGKPLIRNDKEMLCVKVGK